jgi:hypothetical protein
LREISEKKLSHAKARRRKEIEMRIELPSCRRGSISPRISLASLAVKSS